MERSVVLCYADSSLAHTLARTLSEIRATIPFRFIAISKSGNLFPTAHFFDRIVAVNNQDPIEALQDLSLSEDVGLVITTSEMEVLTFGEAKSKLPFALVSAPSITPKLLDKYFTYQMFRDLELPFCETWLPSQFPDSLLNECIVKPRQGERSIGIQWNPAHLRGFSDADFIAQRIVKGVELTSAFYVSKNTPIGGVFTLARTFGGGGCVYDVCPEFNEKLLFIIRKLIDYGGILGPCNLQSFIVDRELLPFEVNARFSSSNYIRAHFGFEDVKWSIQEYVLQEEPVAQIPRTRGRAVTLRTSIVLE